MRQLKETRWRLDHGLPVSAHKMSLGAYLHDWLEVTRARVTSGWYSSRRLALDHTGFKVPVEEDTGRILGPTSWEPIART
jgi:hypothetical protein